MLHEGLEAPELTTAPELSWQEGDPPPLAGPLGQGWALRAQRPCGRLWLAAMQEAASNHSTMALCPACPAQGGLSPSRASSATSPTVSPNVGVAFVTPPRSGLPISGLWRTHFACCVPPSCCHGNVHTHQVGRPGTFVWWPLASPALLAGSTAATLQIAMTWTWCAMWGGPC